jgi:hypothetical protein
MNDHPPLDYPERARFVRIPPPDAGNCPAGVTALADRVKSATYLRAANDDAEAIARENADAVSWSMLAFAALCGSAVGGFAVLAALILSYVVRFGEFPW